MATRPEMTTWTVRGAHGDADMDFLLALANLPDVRAASFSGHEITPKEHRRWFEKMTTDPMRSCHIVCGLNDERCGVLRFEPVAVRMQRVGIAIAPNARRRGMALWALVMMTGNALAAWRVPIVAEIKPDNAASLALFRRAGYEPFVEAPSKVTLIYRPKESV